MIKRMQKARSNQEGFTLVELIVAMAISLVVMAAIYSVYASQQQSYVVQDQIAATQQNLRGALYMMIKDLRMAGFDPKASGLFGVTDAGEQTITFTSDKDKDGDSTDTGETITYFLDSSNNLIRNAGSTDQVVAEDIEAIAFAYSYDVADDGIADISTEGHIIWAVDSDTDGTLDLSLDKDDDGAIEAADAGGITLSSSVPVKYIKSVRIWLLARTDQTIRDYNETQSYVVGSRVITPTKGYKYRIQYETAKCRNL